VLQLKKHVVSTKQKCLYATAEDFEQFFAKDTTRLFPLCLQLTADAEEAQSCLILSMRDCFCSNSVAKGCMDTWARRMVIKNAIRLVLGTPNDILSESGFEFHLQPTEFALEALRESVAILTLPDLDRLAFVICVLERYSILDCALLLKKSPQEVYDAIVRATTQVIPPEERREHEATATSSGSKYGAFWGQANKLESSCGSILD
jgi:hypothetical protein